MSISRLVLLEKPRKEDIAAKKYVRVPLPRIEKTLVLNRKINIKKMNRKHENMSCGCLIQRNYIIWSTGLKQMSVNINLLEIIKHKLDKST